MFMSAPTVTPVRRGWVNPTTGSPRGPGGGRSWPVCARKPRNAGTAADCIHTSSIAPVPCFVMALALWIAGWGGLAVLLGLAGFAQSQLLLSDYVQHYGLRRRIRADGKHEPVAARHSWNAPHWFTGHMMLNAPRHSDHHAHPARRYPDLARPHLGTTPMLPRSLPVMSVVALVPPLWRRSMDKRVAAWAIDNGADRVA